MGVVGIMRFRRIGPAPRIALFAAALCILPASTPALAQTAIQFTLDRRFEGPAAPFFVAIDKGYFKAEGLDVSVAPAKTYLEAITRVASINFDMGFADINALIKHRNSHPDMPIKAVFMVYNKPAYAIIARRSRGIETPQDLVGKKLGAPVDDIAFAQWKIFAAANNIDTAKVKIENIGAPVREPMLAAGQIDAITGLSFASYINLKERGVPVSDIVLLPMADYGVELYGNAIIVDPKFIAEKPEAVKAFLRAFLKGLRDTIRNPARAIESVLKRSDQAKKKVELERLRMVIKNNILTDEVKANGYGAIDNARFQTALNQLALTIEFKTKPKPGDIFDASFLPPAARRKVR